MGRVDEAWKTSLLSRSLQKHSYPSNPRPHTNSPSEMSKEKSGQPSTYATRAVPLCPLPCSPSSLSLFVFPPPSILSPSPD